MRVLICLDDRNFEIRLSLEDVPHQGFLLFTIDLVVVYLEVFTLQALILFLTLEGDKSLRL